MTERGEKGQGKASSMIHFCYSSGILATTY